MPIPTIGAVPTPQGFTVQSAEGQVLLSWLATPTATIYYVSRSTDGITYTEIGTTTLFQYLDTTGVLNTIYYYYIQAGNGTNSSPISSALQAQSLLIGQTTVGNLIYLAQSETDKINSQFLTTQEWTAHINNSRKELYDLLIEAYGCDYYMAIPYAFNTTGAIDPVFGASVYPLPADFYKSMLIEVALNPNDPNSWVTLRQYQRIQQNLWNYPNQYTLYGITNLRYRLTGKYIQLVPIPQANQTIRIWYAPRPSQLLLTTDIVDGISGWEEYIVVDVAIKAQGKEESEQSGFFARKQALLTRIQGIAQNRNVAEPEVVSDSRMRNFAWSDDGGMNGGGNGGGW